MFSLLLVAMAGFGVRPAEATVRVVASLTDLASIASAVGGDEVDVVAIARPNSDPHRVEVLPSYMVRVSRADLYLQVGFGLDAWSSQIIDGSHNGKVQIVDCSAGIEALDKRTGRVDASMGDVHPDGNPHYWLDPENAAQVAETVANALARLDPAHAAEFQSRAEEFAGRCSELLEEGRRAADGMTNRKILTYHQSWIYLANAYGFEVSGTVEPVPGIPPTAKHLQELVGVIEAEKIPTLLAEPYFSSDAAEFLSRETGIVVHQVSPSCDGVGPGSYLEHARELVRILTEGRGTAG